MGNAIFFSYIDPVTKTMDTGFTEHSGCPVFEGEKKIVTQWIRYGVDTENPWDSFNTRALLFWLLHCQILVVAGTVLNLPNSGCLVSSLTHLLMFPS